MKQNNARTLRTALALAAALTAAPAIAFAGNGSVPIGTRHGNVVTRHGTTVAPPAQTAGQTIGPSTSARGSQYGWFGLIGVIGLAGLWRRRS